MGIAKYEDNGREYWKVSVHVRSKKNRKIRVQKLLVKIESEEDAKIKYQEQWQVAVLELARRENEGLKWGEVIEEWDLFLRRWPSERWSETTVRDYIAVTNNWTKDWLRRPAKELTIADGYALFELMKAKKASTQLIYQTKTVINVIYKWGIEHGKITGKDHSPVYSIELKKRDHETEAEILTQDQVSLFLDTSERVEHDWHPVWFFDLHTGLRASELDGVRKEDIELVPKEIALELDRKDDISKNYGFIRVQRQWGKRLKKYKALKGRMWRTIPINSKLYWFLIDYMKNDFGSDEHGQRLFPIYAELRRGMQAQVIRFFCEANGLKNIKFHTLRACFATHLLAAGVSELKVMKIGGWKDRETMMIYVRRAGIDEAGATSVLDYSPRKVLVEKEPAALGNVVSLFGFKGNVKSIS